MSDKVLYRAWRPLDFDQVVGQEHVVSALRQAAVTSSVAHAYLFSGTRGTGKTSLAKIFARAINCPNLSTKGNPCNSCEICEDAIKGTLLDIIEMDAASNNSVDDIRKITDEVLFLPSVAKYKVYIIDEVHMLSTAAFNALLKTLEEPPAHAVFILATTDPQRIPATILSRCQRYDFKRIKSQDMYDHLSLIAEKNGISIDEGGLLSIVNFSDGALRDAISLLDQSRSIYGNKVITQDDILNMVGVVSDEFLEEIIYNMVTGDVDGLMQSIERLIVEGGDIGRFTSALAQYLRNLLVYKTSKHPENLLQNLLQVNSRTLQTLNQLAQIYSTQNLIKDIAFVANLQLELKYSETPRITLEVALIQLLQNVKNNRDTAGISKFELSHESETELAKHESGAGVAKIVEATETIDTQRNPENARTTQSQEEISETCETDSRNVVLSDSRETIGSIETSTVEKSREKGSTEIGIRDEKVQEVDYQENLQIISKTEPQEHCEKHTEEHLETPLETKYADMHTSKKVFSQEEIKSIWRSFINELNEQDPLLAILLNTCQYYVENDKFIINFETEQIHIYDKINTQEVKARVLEAFIKANTHTHLSLEFNIAGRSANEINATKKIKAEPEWVRRMKVAAETMGIPIQDNTNYNNNNKKK